MNTSFVYVFYFVTLTDWGITFEGFCLLKLSLYLIRLSARSGGGYSFTALESDKVEFCATAMAPVVGPFTGNTPVTIRYQGKIPHGQSEIFCFFGSKRVTSDSLYYSPDDDSIVRTPPSHHTLPNLWPYQAFVVLIVVPLPRRMHGMIEWLSVLFVHDHRKS